MALDLFLGLLLSYLDLITLEVGADRFAKCICVRAPSRFYSILLKCHIKDLHKFLRSSILLPSIPGWYLAALLECWVCPLLMTGFSKQVLWKPFSCLRASEPHTASLATYCLWHILSGWEPSIFLQTMQSPVAILHLERKKKKNNWSFQPTMLLAGLLRGSLPVLPVWLWSFPCIFSRMHLQPSLQHPSGKRRQ